ncbi:hypothetical protein MBANPS3_002580 [Mucor bainieri]
MSSNRQLPPEKPKLQHLRGDFVLDSGLRESLRIPSGILCDEVRNWKESSDLVEGFFRHCESAESYTYDSFIQTITSSLDKIKGMDHEGNKELLLLASFAARKFNKQQQQLEEDYEKENLDHEGRLTALIVAQSQSKTIQTQEKGKMKELDVEEGRSDVTAESSSDARKRQGPPTSNPKTKARRQEEIYDTATLQFEVPADSKRYIVNGFDVSQKFFEFQSSLRSQDAKFHAETHVHQILALSSILLLKPARMNLALVDAFGVLNLNLIIKDVEARLKIVDKELPMDTITKITRIIEIPTDLLMMMDNPKSVESN